MTITHLLQKSEQFEIQAYKRPKDFMNLKATHVAFSGSPLRHPTDSEKAILIVDPCSKNTFYYEFNTSDISFIEELPALVNLDGETITMARVWVKKMSVGLRCTPFLVEDLEDRAKRSRS